MMHLGVAEKSLKYFRPVLGIIIAIKPFLDWQ
jgi:hypothetical protein